MSTPDRDMVVGVAEIFKIWRGYFPPIKGVEPQVKSYHVILQEHEVELIVGLGSDALTDLTMSRLFVGIFAGGASALWAIDGFGTEVGRFYMCLVLFPCMVLWVISYLSFWRAKSARNKLISKICCEHGVNL